MKLYSKKVIKILISSFIILLMLASSVHATFRYEHNPMENPKASADIVENSEAIYGYSPNPESKRLGVYADAIDWTNEEEVAEARKQREEYHENNKELYKIIQDMLNNGDSLEAIARKVSREKK